MSAITVNLDLGDEFIECENGSEYCTSISIGEALSDAIKYSVKTEVLKNISEDVKEEIRRQTELAIKEEVKSTIKAVIMNELISLKINTGYRKNEKTIPAKDFIIDKLEDCIKSSDVGASIRKIAEDYTASIRERFDVVFASTLLDKMMKAGLLKDDRISSLLTE